MIGDIVALYVLGIDYENIFNCRIENLSCELASKIEKVVFKEEWKLYVLKIQTLNCRIN